MPYIIEPARHGDNLKFVRRPHGHHHGHHHHHHRGHGADDDAFNRCRTDCAGLSAKQWAAACARDKDWAAAYDGLAREAEGLRRAGAAQAAALAAAQAEAARRREAGQALLGENARLNEALAAAAARADGFKRRVGDQARELAGLRAARDAELARLRDAHAAELARRDAAQLALVTRNAELLRDKRRADDAAALARADAARLRQRLDACHRCHELRHRF